MEVPRHWRIRKERYSMIGGACPNCEVKMFPMRSVCPICGFGAHSVELDNQENQSAQLVTVPSQVFSV